MQTEGEPEIRMMLCLWAQAGMTLLGVRSFITAFPYLECGHLSPLFPIWSAVIYHRFSLPRSGFSIAARTIERGHHLPEV